MDTKMKSAKPNPRRVLCLSLPRFPAERIFKARQRPGAGPAKGLPPFAAWSNTGSRLWIVAATRAAATAGIHPGQSLADAKALCPKLATAAADQAADTQALEKLADWCLRFSPWSAPFDSNTAKEAGEAGIWLDVTGCAYLAGGEEALIDTITGAMTRAGFTARAGLAGTPGAAYALARFNAGECKSPNDESRSSTDAGAIAPPGEERTALAPLPVAALRLDRTIIEGLDGLGLRRIGDLYPLVFGPKRAMLARRFPPALLKRVDQALGRDFEPISPGRERPRFITRLPLSEPTSSEAVIARACERLVADLITRLSGHGLGAKCFTFSAFTTDGQTQQVNINTARAMAASKPLMRLFALKLGKVDPGFGPGFGIDSFSLEAFDTSPLLARQGRLSHPAKPTLNGTTEEIPTTDAPSLAPLIDRLGARFGRKRVGRLMRHPNHLPERAQAFTRTDGDNDSDSRNNNYPGGGAHVPSFGTLPRPVRLLPRPEPLETKEGTPGGPPAWFLWHGIRHPITRCQGPERIALDWWTLPGWQANPCTPAQPPGLGAAIRDYYRVETARGARFWIYRAGEPRPDAPACWFLHGIFP
jgi:protein ImuB